MSETAAYFQGLGVGVGTTSTVAMGLSPRFGFLLGSMIGIGFVTVGFILEKL